MDLSLAGRHVVVVDAEPALAAALVRILGEEGAAVTLLGPDRALDGVLSIAVDLDDPADVARGVAACEARAPVDGVVLASARHRDLGVAGLAPAALAAAFAHDLLRPVAAVEAMLPAMLARGHGAIVLVASSAARLVVPDLAVMAMVHAAAGAWIKQLCGRHAVAGIRANALMVGIAPDLDGAPAAPVNAAHGLVSWDDTLPDAADVADAATFLLCGRAGYVNGCLLPVDGGSNFIP